MYEDKDGVLTLCEEEIKYQQRIQEGILKDWLKEIKYYKPVGYYYDLGKKELTIFTMNPGQLIGKAGINIHTLTSFISERYLGEWKITFQEIKGGIVQPDNTKPEVNVY